MRRLRSGAIRALNSIIIDVGKSSASHPAQARGLSAAIDTQSGGATVGRPGMKSYINVAARSGSEAGSAGVTLDKVMRIRSSKLNGH